MLEIIMIGVCASIFGALFIANQISEYIENSRLDFHGLDQNSLLKKYTILNKEGVCYGLTLDAARHHILHYGTKEDNFLLKLQDKFYNKSTDFLTRINSYQQIQISDKYSISSASQLSEALKIDALKDSKFIGIGIYAKNYGHQIGIKIDEVNGNKEYAIYDPNYGETKKFTSIEAITEAVEHLCKKYYKEVTSFSLMDFEAALKDYYHMDLTSESDKAQKYLVCKMFEAIKNCNISELEKYCAVDKYALTMHQETIYNVYYPSKSAAVLNPLHYAAVTCYSSDFNKILNLAELSFTIEDMYNTVFIMASRKSANYYINSETMNILNSKLSSSVLSDHEFANAKNYIALINYLYGSYYTHLSMEQIDHLKKSYNDYFDNHIETKWDYVQLCTNNESYDELPLVDTHSMYEAAYI